MHAIPIESFIDALLSWAHDIDVDKQDQGKAEVEKLKIFGRLLADDPEFRKIFRCNLDQCADSTPDNAMNCVYAFFNAITDASRPGNAQDGVHRFRSD